MEALPRPDPARRTGAPDPEDAAEAVRVAAWLAAHPGFLAAHPTLYRAMDPPRRVHGERLADHMAAMLAAERAAAAEAARLARRAGDLAARMQRAVLALLAGRDAAETVTQEWPALLGVEAVSLLREGPPARHWRPLARGGAGLLLPRGRESLLRDAGAPDPALHGAAAPLVAREALLRLDGTALLALGARDPGRLPLRGSGAPLAFLARAAAAALARA